MLPSIAVHPPRKGNFVALLLVNSYAQPHSKNSDKALESFGIIERIFQCFAKSEFIELTVPKYLYKQQ